MDYGGYKQQDLFIGKGKELINQGSKKIQKLENQLK